MLINVLPRHTPNNAGNCRLIDPEFVRDLLLRQRSSKRPNGPDVVGVDFPFALVQPRVLIFRDCLEVVGIHAQRVQALVVNLHRRINRAKTILEEHAVSGRSLPDGIPVVTRCSLPNPTPRLVVDDVLGTSKFDPSVALDKSLVMPLQKALRSMGFLGDLGGPATPAHAETARIGGLRAGAKHAERFAFSGAVCLHLRAIRDSRERLLADRANLCDRVRARHALASKQAKGVRRAGGLPAARLFAPQIIPAGVA